MKTYVIVYDFDNGVVVDYKCKAVVSAKNENEAKVKLCSAVIKSNDEVCNIISIKEFENGSCITRL